MAIGTNCLLEKFSAFGVLCIKSREFFAEDRKEPLPKKQDEKIEIFLKTVLQKVSKSVLSI